MQAANKNDFSDFDYIVGNPPWINWETLPDTYRKRIAPLWPLLGLFSPSGNERSFSKEDLSTFITYVVADQRLKFGGTLAFVIPQGIFQSSINSKGFRRFNIKYNNTPLNVNLVQDFTAVDVFNGAASRTAILYISKGKQTTYPIHYERWIEKKQKN